MKKRKRFSWVMMTLIISAFLLAVGFLIIFYCSTSVTNNLDIYAYELPFQQGAKFEVIQGYGGLFSHRHTAAIDFGMPSGTPVYAARGGTIYRYKDDSNEGGPFSKYKNRANYIIIKHDDGSFGCYWHLQKNGVLVKYGYVTAGQQIGYSGATGFVLNPHLHFSVKLKLNYEMNSFTRTKFKTTKGIILLERGQTYERPQH